ncbi:phosphatidate cytidylyltransferase [Candidatus Poribacteria bacterium]|nr:phosphatidate cytidylyltransferase [Candidatus Poribacteria bacterium]
MFWKRVISAIILIPVVIFLVWWGGYPYSALIILVTALMLIEFWGLSQSIGGRGGRIFTVACGVLFCLSAVDLIGSKIPVELALALTLLLPFSYQIFRDKIDVAFLSVASTLLGVIYIGWAFGYHLILLRGISDAGRGLIFFLLVTVWLGDTAAYLFGKRFGRHKLRPTISPGKTIEGTIAGIVFGTLGGFGVWSFFLQDILSFSHALILGVLLGAVSQLSDLSESVIKRSANVKDSGDLIPGHGGLLDRCDSLIFSAPALYYYFVYLVNLT